MKQHSCVLGGGGGDKYWGSGVGSERRVARHQS